MSYNLDALNARLTVSEANKIDELSGLEILLESIAVKVTDIMGKNTLLSMAYQIGKEPAEHIADRILTSRSGQIFTDPIEAFVVLLENIKNYFHIHIKSITTMEGGKISIQFINHCYFHQAVSKRPKLTVGGPLCRITKGYFEGALAKLNKWKADLRLVEEVFDKTQCIEEIIFSPPKQIV
jgi:predicted hydrocarbon binding protein